jgi:hypothetical protein
MQMNNNNNNNNNNKISLEAIFNTYNQNPAKKL